MSAENSKTVAERIKVIGNLLVQSAEERRRANMKGKGNAHKRLIGKICLRGHNEDIIKEAYKIIEILKEENKDLSQIIDRIQNKPPP